jgi:hypothetical protein
MSLLVWLDYSEHERRKMLDVIDRFREADTVDELGLGAIRDAFADRMFPGTSTIMTRARYFLLIPWTYRRLEEKRTPSSETQQRGRDAETRLMDAIEASEDSEGNIGKLAGEKLKRLPSSVYWQGLAVWGIRPFVGSQTQYHRALDAYHEKLRRRSGRQAERDVEHDDLVPPNWHGGLIEPPKDFPAVCSLRLRRQDADYLRERIVLSPGCRGSLLVELVRYGKREVETEFVWQHPLCGRLGRDLAEVVEHARNFSEVMHGAALLYNLILAEQQESPGRVSAYRDALGNWIEGMETRHTAFARWRRDDFWDCVTKVNPAISPNTRTFVERWWDLTFRQGAERATRSGAARALVTERERQLKKSLARINNIRAIELWRGASGARQLDYRWGITQRLLGDIFDGLGRRDA